MERWIEKVAVKREKGMRLELVLNLLSTETKVETDVSSNGGSTRDLDAGVKHLKGLTERLVFDNLKRATTTSYPLNKEGTESFPTVRAPSGKSGDRLVANSCISTTIAYVLIEVAG